MLKTIRIAMIAACALAATTGIGRAAELVMFEQAGCVWCARWNKEIGPAYSKSDEGKRAPLRRIDIHEPLPDDLATIRVERFTPTFVLVDDGREIGRMRGYTGDQFFWFLLDEMLDKLPPAGSG